MDETAETTSFSIPLQGQPVSKPEYIVKDVSEEVHAILALSRIYTRFLTIFILAFNTGLSRIPADDLPSPLPSP